MFTYRCPHTSRLAYVLPPAGRVQVCLLCWTAVQGVAPTREITRLRALYAQAVVQQQKQQLDYPAIVAKVLSIEGS